MLAEDDDLSRFVFAFAGLELLATQVAKDVRAQLIGKIAATNPELPATEVLWASTDEDRADRNRVFRFAAMALLYSSATANCDVEEFRRLHRTRNQLFHAVDRQDWRDQSIQCKELLRHYLEVVAIAKALNMIKSAPTSPMTRASPATAYHGQRQLQYSAAQRTGT